MKKAIVSIIIVMLLVSGTVYADTSDAVYHGGRRAQKEACIENDGECYKEMDIEAVAKVKGLTVEEYKAMIAEGKYDKKGKKPEMTKEEFLAALEAKGITLEEYKAMIVEKYEAIAAEKGMTLEEYKAAVSQKKYCGKKKR